MADCSEDGTKPSTSRSNTHAKSSKSTSKSAGQHFVASRSGRLETDGHQLASSSLDSDQPPPTKRRRFSKFSEAPVPGNRTGLRSQATQRSTLRSARVAEPSGTAAVAAAAGESSSATSVTTTAANKPKEPTRSRIPKSTARPSTAGPSTRHTEASTSPATQRATASVSRTRQSSRSRPSAATASAASTSASSSSAHTATVSESLARKSETTARKRFATSASGKAAATEPKAKKQAVAKQSTSTSSGAASISELKPVSGLRRGNQVATTGDTSSRLKRSTAAAGSSGSGASTSSAQPEQQRGSGPAAASTSSTRRRAAGGRVATTATSTPTSASTASSASTATASGQAGAQAAPADMSASGNGGKSGGQGSSNDHLPVGVPSSLLSEVLRGAAADASGATGGASANDVDMQRLQAMLEARGLPPHMFGSLESNMRNIIQRSMNSGAMNKVTSLIKGMQAKEDEGQQLTAVMEMCQVLVMGNEENLVGFPTKQVVPELVALLSMEHNFDIMMYACRALYYMLEALPRSSLTVVEAVPALLDKLKCIQCMDVAEQSLSALERLSRRHNKNLLLCGAITACLMYLDFFSIDAQRYALAVAANCCVNIMPEEFHYCRESLPLLSGKLLTADKRSVESVCTCFARLVDNLRHDEKLLKELAAHEMLANTLKLLEVAPPVISSSIFTMVIRMFVVMCSNCPELAVCLLRQSVANTLVYLLCGDQGTSKHVELVSRTPQELFEIVSLIGELMPALPTTGLFTVDALLKKHPSLAMYEEEVTWQWKDDKGAWRPYSAIDSRIIEAAYEASEEEVTLSLSDMSRMYTIDFAMMQQINEETGTARPVFRSTESNVVKKAGQSFLKPSKPDARAEVLAEQPELATNFIKSLFGILYEVYSSSAGPAVRHKCLQAILRQIYYASPELLRDVLVNQPVSSHIASMLASQDHKVVVGALQMADILMKKLPDIFTQYFQRQGVTHQINLLAITETPSTSGAGEVLTKSKTVTTNLAAAAAAQPAAAASAPSASYKAASTTDGSPILVTKGLQRASAAATAGTSGAVSAGPSASTLPPPSRPDGAIKPKRYTKRVLRSKMRSSTSESQAGDSSSASPTLSSRGKSSSKKETSSHSGLSSAAANSSSKAAKASFLASFHPSRWASRSNAADKSSASASHSEGRGVSTATLIANYKEKIKTWITTHANDFMSEHFSKLNPTAAKAGGVLLTLTKAASQLSGIEKRGHTAAKNREALEMIAATVTADDVSPFEMIHSGIIEKLLLFLTATSEVASTSTSISELLSPLESRLAMFMSVFIGSPADPSATCNPTDVTEDTRLTNLISKTMSCLHQQEQFQVKVHDLGLGGGGGSTNSTAMKFLSSHQLKCQLQRHPECKTLKQYEGGPVKVDPLAPVHAIENFLIRHGYCKPEGAQSADVEAISDDDDGNSVDDLDDSMPGMLVEQSLGRHTIELVIGERPLSYNQTVLQAVRNHASIDDADSDHGLGGTSVWAQTHVIWYRQASESTANVKPSTSVTKKTRADGAVRSKKSKKAHDFFTDGIIESSPSPLIASLSRGITERMSVKDSCVGSVSLIRTLYYINRYWGSLYGMLSYKPVVADAAFISSKLTAKANRQLQDPLVIMTGNIPQWLPQVASCCPFLFPFETRQMLFYVNSFDRDRAMMRLQDANTDAMDIDTSGRVAPPRIEKKKKVISRENLIKQAEKIFEDVGKSKALLEIQYENEVGTGLGPTLEFYSLVSKELQASSLDIWHGQTDTSKPNDPNEKSYINSTTGLYPKPLARNAKPAVVSKVKAKFKFIGKLLAKALMDARILDLPLNPIVYSWLLGQQKTLTPSDLVTFDPSVATSYSQIKAMLEKVKAIKADIDLSAEEEEKAIVDVGIDSLVIDFTLPGYDHIQLRKGGILDPVHADNVEDYLQLLCHWIFHEGIHRQMESLKEGFDCVFPSTHLTDLFNANELEQLFCGNITTQWDTKELFDCCRADHGYTMDSKTVQNLFELLSSYDSDQQRKFLSFVTGSPRLPVGGFRSLNPQLTIVRKTFEACENPDEFLPSVMTCVNYLKLPDYSSIDIMRAKLDTAATIGQLSFHLS